MIGPAPRVAVPALSRSERSGNTAVMASQGRAGMDRGLPRPLTGSPWENGYIESFNARLRDELLNGEIFYTLREAQIVIESWRRHYNTIRPHASIGYKPSTRGVCACVRRVAGCATPTGSAGHAGATANHKLTFHLDHSEGADQSGPRRYETAVA